MRISTSIRAGAATLALATTLLATSAWASADDHIVIRRDGSQAVQVPAIVDPRGNSPQAAEGFDWDDAGIGAGVTALALALGAAGALLLRGELLAPRPRELSLLEAHGAWRGRGASGGDDSRKATKGDRS
jgi:hypothetical protein